MAKILSSPSQCKGAICVCLNGAKARSVLHNSPLRLEKQTKKIAKPKSETSSLPNSNKDPFVLTKATTLSRLATLLPNLASCKTHTHDNRTSSAQQQQ